MTSPIKVLVVYPDSQTGHLKTIDPSLPVFNDLVGGFIEGLSFPENEVSAYLNEDGKTMGLPVNQYADALVRQLLASEHRRLMPGDVIVGPVVFMGYPDHDTGEDTDVPTHLLALARSLGLDLKEED
jgi:hypothetical protein